MVKGVGVVDQALREAFQILKQVPAVMRPGREGLGGSGQVGGGRLGLWSRALLFPTQFQEAKQGSLCNQAVMLISDGAVEDYEPVFEKYNWPDCKVTLPRVSGEEKKLLLLPWMGSPAGSLKGWPPCKSAFLLEPFVLSDTF